MINVSFAIKSKQNVSKLFEKHKQIEISLLIYRNTNTTFNSKQFNSKTMENALSRKFHVLLDLQLRFKN